MAELFDYKNILEMYSQFQNSDFLNRYLGFNPLENYLVKEIFPVFEHEVIGFSELGKPLYSISIGHGSNNILIWSQMHGNESTTTKSLLDLINYIRLNLSDVAVEALLNSCCIKIILMLNPDGSSRYTRFNANNTDLNRDAQAKTQKETQYFFKYLEKLKPDYCFNMHGQRSIFSAGDQNKPATLSFLAPSYDFDLSINNNREEAMRLIIYAYNMLSDFIPGQIGKYDDAHNPNCFGDYIQKLGIPTVLFEAGHYQNDYNRNISRKYVFLALLKMLENISIQSTEDCNIQDYFKIPNNKELYFDIIIKNSSNIDSQYIGIQYNEILNEDKIIFQPYVKAKGNLSNYYAHLFINANYNKVKINESLSFEIGQIIEELTIGDDYIELNLRN
jgi:hypothetical protein